MAGRCTAVGKCRIHQCETATLVLITLLDIALRQATIKSAITPPMNIEIRNVSLRARIQKQLEATGLELSSSAPRPRAPQSLFTT